MPLPVTKGELNRLGDRLVATETPSEADLKNLEVVLAAYQEVLERVKADLRALGFAPGGRLKTTKTMTDKLRRTHGMELSRVQDLAGARIVVDDIPAQDAARAKIGEFYARQGCPLREVDRRKDPRFGYRAVHLIVSIDAMPAEIQIRTELQDTWAQIFERLADRWGRGIRYGQDPENPEGVVRSGDIVTSRRGIIANLMGLSDGIAGLEGNWADIVDLQRSLDMLANLFEHLEIGDWGMEKIGVDVWPQHAAIAESLAALPESELDPETQALLEAGNDITRAQMLRMAEILYRVVSRRVSRLAAQVRSREEEVRDILQVVASATDEGV
jgi:ppGpp synthetase/RelA/SpoT-type nucleotidyltranferase